MEKDNLIKILELVVYAPSGENSQPWRFEVQNNKLYVYNLPDRDNPVYNYRQRGSYLAHGALLENINIISSSFGYKPIVNLFPKGCKNSLVAEINFEKINKQDNKLMSKIKERSTNRKKYLSCKLDEQQKVILHNAVASYKNVRVLFVSELEKKDRIAKSISVADRLMLEHKPLHDAIFNNIRWDEEEEKKHKTGLYVKTMELAPPEAFVFRLLRHWSFARILNYLGFSSFIAKENAKKYKTASEFAIFVIKNEDKNFVDAGRATQRLWLELVNLGLSGHPVAGLSYLMDSIVNGGAKGFTKKHKTMIEENYIQLKNVCDIREDEIIAMVLRVGKSNKAGFNSSKLSPDIEFKD